MKYTTDGNTVFAGKKAIATMLASDNGYELAVMQGLPRMEVVEKIIKDLPDFAAKENIKGDKIPSLVTQSRLKQLNL